METNNSRFLKINFKDRKTKIILLILLIGFFVFNGVIGYQKRQARFEKNKLEEQESKIEEANQEEVKIINAVKTDIQSLLNEYENNSVAFFDKYNGKKVQFSAPIVEVMDWNLPAGYNVIIDVDGSFSRYLGVSCYFPESEKDNISKLNKGQTITIIGEPTEEFMHQLGFMKCTFVSSPYESVK